MGVLAARPFQGHAGFEALGSFWDALVARTGIDRFCNSHDWILAHARAFTPDAELFGWTVEDADGQPLGALALRKEPARGALALRRVTLAQDGSFDSDYLDVPIVAERREEVWVRLLEELTRSRRAEAVVLSCVPQDSPTLPLLRELLQRRGLDAREAPYPCAAARLPESFDAFLRSLKPRMRSKVRAARRKLDEQGAVFHWIGAGDDLTTELEGLYDLHQRRWVAAGQAGSFADARRRALYADIVPRWLAQGSLRFAKLTLAGRPVAYQIGPLIGGTYYQLQEGYDPELADLRIGVGLRALALERLIDEGVESYDSMAGSSRHKADWGAAERPCVTLAFPLPRLRARLAYRARAWADRLRR